MKIEILQKRLERLHSLLIDEKKDINLISDTGSMDDGWVVYTVNCKKKDLMEKIKGLEKEHKDEYPIKTD